MEKLILIASNLKFYRKRKGYTQEQLAEKIGIKRSLLGAYEEGRAEPNLVNLLKFSEVLDVGLEELVSGKSENEEMDKVDIEGRNIRVLSISLNNKDEEQIHLVQHKASAGYLNGFADPEFISNLPVFGIPGYKNGSFRAFEISGDSMLPIQSGTIIIGRYIDNWGKLKNQSLCIIITKSEGLVFKRVVNKIKEGKVELISDNPLYKPFEVKSHDILEIWEARGYFSSKFPDPETKKPD